MTLDLVFAALYVGAWRIFLRRQRGAQRRPLDVAALLALAVGVAIGEPWAVLLAGANAGIALLVGPRKVAVSDSVDGMDRRPQSWPGEVALLAVAEAAMIGVGVVTVSVW